MQFGLAYEMQRPSLDDHAVVEETIEQCIRAARRGGTAVLVGVGRMQERFSVNNLVLPITAKTIKGCMYGSINFKTDFALYLDLYRRGQLDLDRAVPAGHQCEHATHRATVSDDSRQVLRGEKLRDLAMDWHQSLLGTRLEEPCRKRCAQLPRAALAAGIHKRVQTVLGIIIEGEAGQVRYQLNGAESPG